jgi:hypothetical protein
MGIGPETAFLQRQFLESQPASRSQKGVTLELFAEAEACAVVCAVAEGDG